MPVSVKHHCASADNLSSGYPLPPENVNRHILLHLHKCCGGPQQYLAVVSVWYHSSSQFMAVYNQRLSQYLRLNITLLIPSSPTGTITIPLVRNKNPSQIHIADQKKSSLFTYQICTKRLEGRYVDTGRKLKSNHNINNLHLVQQCFVVTIIKSPYYIPMPGENGV